MFDIEEYDESFIKDFLDGEFKKIVKCKVEWYFKVE